MRPDSHDRGCLAPVMLEMHGGSTGRTAYGETVVFTLHPGMVEDDYSCIVSGAGISSDPVIVHIDQAEIDGAPGREVVFPPAP